MRNELRPSARAEIDPIGLGDVRREVAGSSLLEPIEVRSILAGTGGRLTPVVARGRSESQPELGSAASP